MRLARHVMQTALIAATALISCALILAYAVSLVDSRFQPLNWAGLSASGSIVLVSSVAIGLPVTLLYGVPVFVALARRGNASWRNVLGAAILPAGLVAAALPPAAVFVAGFALPVAAAVRRFAWAGPNNSSKPTPLRGAA